ncbi:MAG: glycogen/starch synthase [Chlamydiae bacterium]|nr:glycogen/starch synthase [Chlamydiota bacterium]
MHIIHLSSELSPAAKVGGLGDVVHSLSVALIKEGHNVEVILPKYDTFDYSLAKNLQVHYRNLLSYDGSTTYNNTIWSCQVDGISVLLVEPHHPSYFFSRGMIYGCPDDIDRFLYFTRASMEFIFKSGRKPDAIHLHDWPVAIAATLQKDMYSHLGLQIGGMLLTLHNIEHQGHCGVNQIARIGLDSEKYTTQESPKEVINLLERGIIDSTWITTVSATYLKEIMTLKGGHGLDLILKKHQSKIQGILNGIDYNYWNPKTDPYLSHHFNTPFESADHEIESVIKAKSANKKELQKRLGLRQRQVPLICCVTRLVHQKGPALIAKAIRRTLHHKGQFILLGSEGSNEMNKLFLSLQHEFAHTKDFSLILERNESLAHLTFAGSDMTIVPSLFEPCGLTQMIALRYASIPIVRKTGGLADTVFDISESKGRRNGFTFTEALDEMVDNVIDRAIGTYQKEKELWSELIENAVASDHSWGHSMHEYLSCYKNLRSITSKPVKKQKKKES